ncbi:MAG: ATP-binding cassette domain-containing protein [Lewinellaceae bacterium]|nr:ATP-binding cassette domain-containing protein [Lewinellaceae bacterium]
MTIHLQNAGKRFRLDWIFRGLDYTFRTGERYAVLGPNGSGKSTLLKVLSGHLTPSKGKVVFEHAGAPVEPDAVYRHISYAAPYIELIEEFTLEEALKFHAGLKPLLPGFNPAKLYELLALPRARTKEIRFFFRHETTGETRPRHLHRHAGASARRTRYQPRHPGRGVVQKSGRGICRRKACRDRFQRPARRGFLPRAFEYPGLQIM